MTSPDRIFGKDNVSNFGSADPTYRISKLAAANKRPISVSPDTNKREAITHMLTNDFSQLPVMTSDREVKVVISWMSMAHDWHWESMTAVLRI